MNFSRVFWSKLPYKEELRAAIEAHRLKAGALAEANPGLTPPKSPMHSKSPLLKQKPNPIGQGHYIDLEPRLYQRLCTLSKVYDMGTLIANKEISELTAGASFGELALLNNEVRQATI